MIVDFGIAADPLVNLAAAILKLLSKRPMENFSSKEAYCTVMEIGSV